MVVTNSLVQLERLIDTQEGKQASLASAPEYAFFRDRYPRADAEKGEESALAVLTDATIRRWCGPRWRIADSRRTCAAAVLSELQAERMSDFVKGDVEKTVLHTDRPLPGAGEIRLTPAGVTSGTYGSLDFLTPIVELPMEKVTQAEANTYNTWRNGYQSNWSNFFDPVALRLAVKAGKISADVTVMPLIVSSEYRQYVDMTSGVKLASGAGDPHDALLHLAVALNHDAGPVKDIGDFFKRWDDGRAKVKLDPLGWVGESAAIYVDDDEAFWAEAAKADDFQKFLSAHIDRLPIALRVENKNGFKLAAFLTTVHGYVDQSAGPADVGTAEVQGAGLRQGRCHENRPGDAPGPGRGAGRPGDLLRGHARLPAGDAERVCDEEGDGPPGGTRCRERGARPGGSRHRPGGQAECGARAVARREPGGPGGRPVLHRPPGPVRPRLPPADAGPGLGRPADPQRLQAPLPRLGPGPIARAPLARQAG